MLLDTEERIFIMNIATQLRESLGIPSRYTKEPRNYTFTKKGPGRVYHSKAVRIARKQRQDAIINAQGE